MSAERLAAFIATEGVDAETVRFEESVHSVAEAAEAAGAHPTDLIKSVCMLTDDDRLVVAIVKGEDRASPGRVAWEADAKEVRLATPDEVKKRTGYPVGGVPPFGYDATFLVDERVTEKDAVLGGGGTDRALVRVAPEEILRATGARVARVRA